MPSVRSVKVGMIKFTSAMNHSGLAEFHPWDYKGCAQAEGYTLVYLDSGHEIGVAENAEVVSQRVEEALKE